MNRIDFLCKQLNESRTFVNRLISELPANLWYAAPDGANANFAWQIGHLIVAQNFHAVTVITGTSEAINKIIPVREYVRLFNGMGTLHRSVEAGLFPVSKLKEQLDAVHQICITNLLLLNDDVLDDPLEPIPFKHPVANTKYEALSWCFKHEMWHAAEMEDIKRRLGHPIKWMDKE